MKSNSYDRIQKAATSLLNLAIKINKYSEEEKVAVIEKAQAFDSNRAIIEFFNLLYDELID